MLRIYNPISRKKEEVTPGHGRTISMYACGPTVYYFAHIGNMRTYSEEDILKRVLIHNGYSVKHIMNITDVGHLVGDGNIGEDKIAMTAKKEGKDAKEIVTFYTDAFFSDLKELNILLPDKTPKATEHIKEMLTMIKNLYNKGFLYKIRTGMYFDTSKFKEYGVLTGMNFNKMNENLIAGARVKREHGIRNTTDFAVWRFLEDGNNWMVWDSEWGRGFPGWHIECSAMSMKYLGETIDIHCGGVDHIPIHHTNEIAQSEAATGKKFVTHWFHVEFLTVNGSKMSKSLGNIYTLEDIKKKGFEPVALRYFLISGHYRQKLNFTFEALESAQRTLEYIFGFVERLTSHMKFSEKSNKKFIDFATDAKSKFFKSLDDDLDMPNALSSMHMLIRDANKALDKNALSEEDIAKVLDIMLSFDEILGLGIGKKIVEEKHAPLDKEIEDLINERNALRGIKDFAGSDRIRKLLLDKYKIIVEDTSEGTKWKKAK